MIDFNTEIPQASDPSTSNAPLHAGAQTFFSPETRHPGALSHPGPEYVNSDVVNPRAPQSTSHHDDASTRHQMHGATTTSGSHRDPFDMSKLHLLHKLQKYSLSYNKLGHVLG